MRTDLLRADIKEHIDELPEYFEPNKMYHSVTKNYCMWGWIAKIGGADPREAVIDAAIYLVDQYELTGLYGMDADALIAKLNTELGRKATAREVLNRFFEVEGIEPLEELANA